MPKLDKPLVKIFCLTCKQERTARKELRSAYLIKMEKTSYIRRAPAARWIATCTTCGDEYATLAPRPTAVKQARANERAGQLRLFGGD